jgi:hypothetical protein
MALKEQGIQGRDPRVPTENSMLMLTLCGPGLLLASFFTCKKRKPRCPATKQPLLSHSTTNEPKQTPTNMIYCPSATLVYRDLLGFLMSYCPEGDSLWLTHCGLTTRHSMAILLASTRWTWPNRTPPTNTNQHDLLPKLYFHIKNLLGFLMVYCPEEDVMWFMSYKRLKLGNFDGVEFTGIYRLTFM